MGCIGSRDYSNQTSDGYTTGVGHESHIQGGSKTASIARLCGKTCAHTAAGRCTYTWQFQSAIELGCETSSWIYEFTAANVASGEDEFGNTGSRALRVLQHGWSFCVTLPAAIGSVSTGAFLQIEGNQSVLQLPGCWSFNENLQW